MWPLLKEILVPLVPRGDPKSLEVMSLGPTFFFCSYPLNKVPLSLPHPQKKIWGSNVDLFSNMEADFEAEMLSAQVKGKSDLNVFHLKITHTKG